MLFVRDCTETLVRGIVDFLDLKDFSCIYSIWRSSEFYSASIRPLFEEEYLLAEIGRALISDLNISLGIFHT